MFLKIIRKKVANIKKEKLHEKSAWQNKNMMFILDMQGRKYVQDNRKREMIINPTPQEKNVQDKNGKMIINLLCFVFV